ncbi:MAG: MarR family transcriptional regulator [Acidimicrobiales bacterium]
MPTSHIDPETVARLRMAMARLARRQRQAASTGLTPSQQSALAMIDRHGPLPLSELATLEQVAKPTITRIVAKLEEQGLVERLVDTVDRRFARVVVTAVGHERIEETRQRRNQWLTERIEGLSPDDIAAIFAVVEPLERLLEVELTGSRV